MKRKEYLQEVRGLAPEALRTRLADLEKQIVKMSCKNAVEPLKEAHLFRAMRRERARLLTVIAEKAQSN